MYYVIFMFASVHPVFLFALLYLLCLLCLLYGGGLSVRVYGGWHLYSTGEFILEATCRWLVCVSVVRVSVARVLFCVLHFNREVDVVNVVFLVEVLCSCLVAYLKLLYVLFDCCVSF